MKKLVTSPFVNVVEAYCPPPFQGTIDLHLDGNEGVSIDATLLREVAGLDVEMVRRYPDARVLETLLAKRLEVSVDRLIVTAGADDALERAIRGTVAPGKEVVLPMPTFEMIDRYVQLAGGTVCPVHWMEGPFPVDAVIGSITPQTSMICVVTPNSPTGLVASYEDIRRISEAAPGILLVVDLAYIEFADEDITNAVLSLPNTVVMRTLSKAWGLAGARVGYAVGCLEAIKIMRTVGHPYAVSSLSLALAVRRLETGGGDVAAFVDRVKKERAALVAMLRSRGCDVEPSQGNFIHLRVADSMEVRNGLARFGIAVRAFPGKRHLENSLRITVPGESKQFTRLIEALEKVISFGEQENGR